MADFSAAIKVILGHEGGLSDHPLDHGGVTNFGLTIPFLNGNADPNKFVGHPLPWTREDILHMTIPLAVAIYKESIWDRNQYGLIEDTLVATKAFDMAVNMGEVQGEKLVQRAVNATGYTPALMVDGNFGPKSFAAINSLSRDVLLPEIVKQQKLFYQRIIERDPSQKVFEHGWMDRAEWPY
jgi:lysozyme family protein